MSQIKLFIIPLLGLLSHCTEAIPHTRSSIAKPRSNSEDYLLPKTIRPQKYTITLEPFFENETFTGSVLIDFEVTDTTDTIVLHARDLVINSETIIISQTNFHVIEYTFDENDDKYFHTFKFNGTFTKGQTYKLEIHEFTGVLNRQNDGFYIAEYTDSDGTQRKFATTQFESTAARRAFPCLDEPDYKATYELIIIRPESYNSLSNVPPSVTGRPLSEGRYVDMFEIKNPMSTYLLAFIVSELEGTVNMGIHHVYARPEAVENELAQFPLYIGYLALKAESNFVAVNYTLEKMDQVAIPDDYFAAGAMENWGLVTYRESYLLYSEKQSTTSQQQTIATVIAHEFSHQWFGDLVSPKWWSYTWLNEGFATYFEFFGAAIAEPDWELPKQFPLKTLQYAFAPDALESTRSMNADLGSPADISGGFDTIAYEKAGAVIRMAETFLTTEVFKSGLNSYLLARQFQTAEPTDLYNNWQLAADGKNVLPTNWTVNDILSTWDSVEGYPVVDVHINYTEKTATLTQTRFLLKNSTGPNGAWTIPLTFAVQDSANFSDLSTDGWLKDTSATFQLQNITSERWFIVNKQQRGYYRVNYDEENWRLLIDYLNSDDFENIDVNNRAQLLDDAFNLARSGRLDYTIAFDLASYLKREKHYVPFYSFFTALDFINQQLSASDEYDSFKAHILDILEELYDYLGPQELVVDSHTDTFNRINLLTWLCRLGHEDCRNQASEQLYHWSVHGIPVRPNLQAPFFCGAATIANQSVWDFLYSKYETETDANLKGRILSGLGCSEDSDILGGYLDKVFNTTSSSSLQAKHRSTALASIYNAGRFGRLRLVSYIDEHYDQITASGANVESLLTAVSNRLASDSDLELVSNIVYSHKLSNSTLNGAQENVEWNNNHISEIEDWFSEKDAGGAGTIISTLALILSALLILKFVV